MASELYRLNIQGRHAQEYNECTMYYVGDNLTAGNALVNARDLVNNWFGECMGAWLDLFPTTYQVERLTACRQDVGGGIEVVHQFQLGDQIGTVSGGASAQQLCPIVRWIPPINVKSAGRNFLPCIAEADINSNQPIASWFTRLQSFTTIVIAGFVGGSITWTQAIYSRNLNQYHKAMGADTSPIIGWQRRRQRPY